MSLCNAHRLMRPSKAETKIMKKFIRNQLTLQEINQLRTAWKAMDSAHRRYDFTREKYKIQELAAAAQQTERQLHDLWRSHGWADQPTFEIGVLLSCEGII